MSYKVGERPVYLVGENREAFKVKTLAEGEVQDYKILKAKAKSSGQPFVDPEFDCDTQDLIGHWDDKPEKKIVWVRPKEIKEDAVFSKVDKTGNPYPRSAIKQGKLGDCYYLTALGMVTTQKLLADFVIPEDNNEDLECGIFHFRYWVKGYYFDIVVDDRIPCIDYDVEVYHDDGYMSRYRPVAAVPMGDEFWPVLAEKAYAKFYGSYGRTCSGSIAEAVEDFTGGFIEEIPLNKSGALLFENLNPKQEFGCFFGFGTPDTAISGLVPGHAYACVEIAELKNLEGQDIQLLRMRNPWGHKEWTGDWSDTPRSPKWDTISPADRDRLLSQTDDGEFWMSFEDASNPKHFRVCRMCYYNHDLRIAISHEAQLWERYNFHGEWKGDSAQPTQPIKEADFSKKPQYLIKLQRDDIFEFALQDLGLGLVISLLWTDFLDRPLESPDVTYIKMYDIKDKSLLTQGPPFPADVYNDTSKMVERKIPAQFDFSERLEFCKAMSLGDGIYLVIPYVFTKRVVEGKYLLRFQAKSEFEITGPGVKDEKWNVNLPQYEDFKGKE